jgi:3-phenylpropionate/trans-cinnamate dioxygenase ferredoxin reductase component
VPGFWTTICDSDVKYERGGATVGVLTLNSDDDYDLGEHLLREGAPAPVPMR